MHRTGSMPPQDQPHAPSARSRTIQTDIHTNCAGCLCDQREGSEDDDNEQWTRTGYHQRKQEEPRNKEAAEGHHSA